MSELMSLGTGHWYSEGQSGVTLNQVTWPPLRGFTKGWLPPSFFAHWGFLTNTQNTIRPQLVDGHHSEKEPITGFALSEPPGEEITRGNDRMPAAEERTVWLFFYLFLSSKEVQMSPRRELVQISVKTLNKRIRWASPTARRRKGKGTPCWHWQYRDTRVHGTRSQWFFCRTTKSNNQELDPGTGDIFYILVLCMSCHGEHILFSLLVFSRPDPRLLSPSAHRGP